MAWVSDFLVELRSRGCSLRTCVHSESAITGLGFCLDLAFVWRYCVLLCRGHTVAAVSDCFVLAKDAGFKIVVHMMPDLPNVGWERDVESFR